MDKQNEQAKMMGKIISRCRVDEAFKQRFISDPMTVIKEAGLDMPPGVKFKVVENTDKVNYIVLPAESGKLSDDQLDSVSGGCIPRYSLVIPDFSPDPIGK